MPEFAQAEPSQLMSVAVAESEPGEAAMLDSEVARISRVAESLGLRPMGLSKV